MSIQLFRKKDFRGESATVASDVADVKASPVAGRPTSLRMSAAADRVLLFKQPDFGGACLFRSGVRSVADLGSPREGGEVGFGNSVESVRVTPFGVDVHATFIRNAAGVLHPSAKDVATNIMNSPAVPPATAVVDLFDEQVSDVHACLARNPARKSQRRG